MFQIYKKSLKYEIWLVVAMTLIFITFGKHTLAKASKLCLDQVIMNKMESIVFQETNSIR